MSLPWRDLGINYIRYSNICAHVLRGALKPEFKAAAERRSESHVKCMHWINGEQKPTPTQD